MKIVFSKFAQKEMEDAALFYELEFKGFGKEFRNEVKKAALRLVRYPRAWSIIKGDIRKSLLHRFPYGELCKTRDFGQSQSLSDFKTSRNFREEFGQKHGFAKFSYSLLYSIEEDHIFIIAVAHQHRKPGYWIDRLD